MFCKVCGADIAEGRKFCTNCGTKIVWDVKEEMAGAVAEQQESGWPDEDFDGETTVLTPDMLPKPDEEAAEGFAEEAVETVQEPAGEVVEQVQESANEVVEQVQESANEVAESVPDAAGDTFEEATAYAGKSAEASEEMTEKELAEVDEAFSAAFDTISEATEESTDESAEAIEPAADIIEQAAETTDTYNDPFEAPFMMGTAEPDGAETKAAAETETQTEQPAEESDYKKTETAEKVPDESVSVEETPKKKKTWLIILIIVLVVLLILSCLCCGVVSIFGSIFMF